MMTPPLAPEETGIITDPLCEQEEERKGLPQPQRTSWFDVVGQRLRLDEVIYYFGEGEPG